MNQYHLYKIMDIMFFFLLLLKASQTWDNFDGHELPKAWKL